LIDLQRHGRRARRSVEDDVKDEVEEEEDEEGLRRVCRKNGAPKKKRQKKKFSTESQGFGHLYFSLHVSEEQRVRFA
jgi:hypothetical protein